MASYRCSAGLRPAAPAAALPLPVPTRPLLAPSPTALAAHSNSARATHCSSAAPTLAAHDVANAEAPSILRPQSRTAESSFAGRYRLGAKLGQGSHGIVYEGFDLITGEEVAVKVVPKLRYSGRSQKSALHKEAAIWRRACAASPQATRVLGIEEDFNSFYIVQEQCRGGSLQQVLDTRGSLSEAELSEVAYCILNFLSAMHREGIYYGDLKPGNVILKDALPTPCRNDSPSSSRRPSSSGCLNVKVVDFGCSQLVDPAQPLRAMTGTPFFSAPEVIAGAYGLPADLWALGVMLYALICNQLPFWLEPVSELELMDIDAVYSSIQLNPVIFAGPRWRGISESLKDLICQLLEKDASRRPTAEQALAHPWFDEAREMCAMLV